MLRRALPMASTMVKVNTMSKMTTPLRTITRSMASLQPQKTTAAFDDVLADREKPQSLSYFTGNFKYNDLLIELDALYKQHADWKPVVDLDTTSLPEEKTYTWKLRDKMSEMLAIPLKTSQWRKITLHLNQLASLPRPLPSQVAQVLTVYERFDSSALKQQQQQQQNINGGVTKALDDMGRAYAVGRRKESSARCWVVKGEGKVLVNGMELQDYFQRPVDRDQVVLPLAVTELAEKYNVWTIVTGGGTTGQAEAIKLGVGKALLIHDNELKPTLRKAGCITRDPRVVERKKEGQRKARAKYTWVKR
ncbi:ribosomal protein S5 domain 2-type protein [Absidia repens]|uniref:Small ribosomal subunit protein uS9m n=1 Tax=Absidia repens TaxID=90262 RepID=A0A1X2IPX8_9FUNG|nr:ribosomal protein S5 domain 2-type protein [Absidia repens]